MGAIWLQGVQLRGVISEVVGHKSGLALSLDELVSHTPEEYRDLLNSTPDDAAVRIRSEDYEDLVCGILYGLGTVSSRYVVMPGLSAWAEVRNQPERRLVVEKILAIIAKWHCKAVQECLETGNKIIDPTPIIQQCKTAYGDLGEEVVCRYLVDVETKLVQSPFALHRTVEFADKISLKELYDSESLQALYGNFIDQRYIDYLYANSAELHQMNWRKFEGLTAEFFSRQGMHVQIGPGRDDNGIDLRVWAEEPGGGVPPTILIQCKRTRRSVEKVVVKALWADIEDEDAESGLIVTTSRLSPGAEKVITARGYPINTVDGASLSKWVKAMRTIDSGIFMAE